MLYQFPLSFRSPIKTLYVGPFVLDSILQIKALQCKRRLEEEYDVIIDMVIADPPFHTDDIDCKGYWLKPDAKVYEQ